MSIRPLATLAALLLGMAPALAASDTVGSPGAGTPSNSGGIESGTTGQGRSSGSSNTGNADAGNGTAGTTGSAPARSGRENGVPVR